MLTRALQATRSRLLGGGSSSGKAGADDGLVTLLRRTVPFTAQVVVVGRKPGEGRSRLTAGGYQHVSEARSATDLAGLPDDACGLALVTAALDDATVAEVVRVANQVVILQDRRGKASAAPFVALGMIEVAHDALVPGGPHVVTHLRRMDKLSTLHEFWRQPAPPGNNPRDYIGPVGRSQALLEMVQGVLPPGARILELGCNVGRNLAHLHDNGYPDVVGVEINPHAVELLRETYPQLADVPVHLGAGGQVLPTFADDEFDLVYTMAVLEHIHPDESSVFDDMVRIGKHVLAIEPRNRLTHRQFPHDIHAIFSSRGMTHRFDKPMGDFPSNARDKAMKDFTASWFSRGSSAG